MWKKTNARKCRINRNDQIGFEDKAKASQIKKNISKIKSSN